MTETHVQPGDKDPQGRMGRLIAFLASMAEGTPAELVNPLHSIAASKSTGVDIDEKGLATITAAEGAPAPWAYFVTAPNAPPTSNRNQPLDWKGIAVTRLGVGAQFNVLNWTYIAGPRQNYTINVNNGLLSEVGNDDFY